MRAWIGRRAVTRGLGSDAARPWAVARWERAVAPGGKAVTVVLGGHSGGRSGRSGAALGHSAPRSGASVNRTGDVTSRNHLTVSYPSPSSPRLPKQPRKKSHKGLGGFWCVRGLGAEPSLAASARTLRGSERSLGGIGQSLQEEKRSKRCWAVTQTCAADIQEPHSVTPRLPTALRPIPLTSRPETITPSVTQALLVPGCRSSRGNEEKRLCPHFGGAWSQSAPIVRNSPALCHNRHQLSGLALPSLHDHPTQKTPADPLQAFLLISVQTTATAHTRGCAARSASLSPVSAV
ncbi:hypothetical protein ALCH109712_09530 [Alkalicoccus chagannorensis]